jgi:hypothetical protein
MKYEVTPKMQFTSIALGILSGIVSLAWIGYLVVEKAIAKKKEDAGIPK